MIEIVFSDSACGSLKMAQHYGQGNHIGSCTGVIFSKKDGTEPTPEEIAEAQRQAEEQQRAEWENAVPMGGSPKDVFGFNLMLSVGDISAADFIEGRKKAIEPLWSIYPDNPSGEPLNFTDELINGIEIVRSQLTQKDEVRIWYSNQPDELCGLYWFMWELERLPQKPKTVYTVKLPDYEYRENNTVAEHQPGLKFLRAIGIVTPDTQKKQPKLFVNTVLQNGLPYNLKTRHCAQC